MKKLKFSLIFGYAFLYLPILVLIAYSFNDSDRVMLFTHFSTRWYAALWQDAELIGAALLSFKIAAISASFSVLIGLCAGMVLHRYSQFRGRTLFVGLLAVPIILPEIILGLCLLLLFIASHDLLGLPSIRGSLTISIAHITLALGYVTIIILASLNRNLQELDEAAADLGASAFTIFWRITLPLLRPALASGWLLSFMLSLDDLIVASFVSGPGAKTLPMLIFSKIRFGVNPEINAVSSLLILVTILILSIYLLFVRKKAK
ncbi:MAG: ABC transporter permease subunit [Rhizobiales bacterium]|nr:ABC transporter permease subunit [Hyphomicrobiales bacterium]NRB14233.1 ABC transporter permease subunit [Hyphomicrobiales bacterium]